MTLLALVGVTLIDVVLVSSGINSLSDQEKARLTTWLVDQRALGNTQPEITETDIDYVKARRPLPVHERAERLLQFISKEGRTVADPVWIAEDTYAAYAWSESTEWAEVDYCLDYLMQQSWLNRRDSTQAGSLFTVSVGGYSRIAEKETNVDSSQAFVAMWFDDSLKEAFDEGVEPAIREAGYKAMRIDRDPTVDKIDDAIISEIRRSRFLVADFTHGEKGARGGVYYEAGFAYGLGDSPSSTLAAQIWSTTCILTRDSIRTSCGRLQKSCARVSRTRYWLASERARACIQSRDHHLNRDDLTPENIGNCNSIRVGRRREKQC